MRTHCMLYLVVVLLSTPLDRAGAQSVDLFFDDSCTCTGIDAPRPGEPFDLYVVLHNWDAGYFDGVAFSIRGLPQDWTYEYQANPLATEATDPLARDGAYMRFKPRPHGFSDCFILYTCTITPSETASSGLYVSSHKNLPCFSGAGAASASCLGPENGLCVSVCLGTGRASLTGAICTPAPVAPGNWSHVKTLFR